MSNKDVRKDMGRRGVLLRGTALAAAAGLAASGPIASARAQARSSKPNILVIMGDDVGWFNIGAKESVSAKDRRKRS